MRLKPADSIHILCRVDFVPHPPLPERAFALKSGTSLLRSDRQLNVLVPRAQRGDLKFTLSDYELSLGSPRWRSGYSDVEPFSGS